MKKKHTWGTIFRNALARGEDHGYAAFLADKWEKRRDVKTRDVRCPDCGNYYGGHATCGLDICDCHDPRRIAQ